MFRSVVREYTPSLKLFIVELITAMQFITFDDIGKFHRRCIKRRQFLALLPGGL